MTMDALYKEVADLLLKKGQCVALTGAGISAESGIPTFRSKGGLWEKYDPMVYASAEVFRRDPSKYWMIRNLRPAERCWSLGRRRWCNPQLHYLTWPSKAGLR
jgi:hypothetical protein